MFLCLLAIDGNPFPLVAQWRTFEEMLRNFVLWTLLILFFQCCRNSSMVEIYGSIPGTTSFFSYWSACKRGWCLSSCPPLPPPHYTRPRPHLQVRFFKQWVSTESCWWILTAHTWAYSWIAISFPRRLCDRISSSGHFGCYGFLHQVWKSGRRPVLAMRPCKIKSFGGLATLRR